MRQLLRAVGWGMAIFLVACLLSSPAMADTITFDSGQDTALVSYGRYSNYRYGNSSWLWQWHGSREIQTLIRFDDVFGNNPGEIPLGSTITSAMLRIYLYNGSQLARRVYELTTDWNENTATWNNFSPGGGVDVATQTTGTPVTTYTRPTTGWFDIDVTASLQQWATGTSNFGWAIISEQVGGPASDWSGFYSFNNSNLRPTLAVNYTPQATTPEPGTMLLFGSALGMGAWFRRRKKS